MDATKKRTILALTNNRVLLAKRAIEDLEGMIRDFQCKLSQARTELDRSESLYEEIKKVIGGEEKS